MLKIWVTFLISNTLGTLKKGFFENFCSEPIDVEGGIQLGKSGSNDWHGQPRVQTRAVALRPEVLLLLRAPGQRKIVVLLYLGELNGEGPFPLVWRFF